MKRILLFVAVLAVLAACDKNTDEGKFTAPKKLGIKEINFSGDFKHIKFDSAYVLTFQSQLQEMCERDNVDAPAVDFTKNTVIALTSIAPSEIKSINPELTEKEGKYSLDMKVEVEKTGNVHPRKWSILFEAPLDTDPQIICNIEYDRDFDAAAMPDSLLTYIEGSYTYYNQKTDGEYLVIIAAEDSIDFFNAVNNNAMIYRKSAFGINETVNPDGVVREATNPQWENPFYSFKRIEPTKKLMQIIIVNCGSKTIFSELDEKIIFQSQGYDYKSFEVSGCAFPIPRLHLLCSGQTAQSLTFVTEAINGELINQNTIQLNNGSKLNAAQLSELLLEAKYTFNISSASFTLTRHTIE